MPTGEVDPSSRLLARRLIRSRNTDGAGGRFAPGVTCLSMNRLAPEIMLRTIVL
jgi:hypothetical protein